MPYKDPEDKRRNSRAYREKHRTKILAKGKIWRDSTKQQRRTRALHYQHGITDAAFDAMWIAQNGRCAICRIALAAPPVCRGATDAPCIDHDHASGKIRELLCMLCNRGLGNFRDSAENLIRAADYISRHQHTVDSVTEGRAESTDEEHRAMLSATDGEE